MNPSCPQPDELARLLDGDTSENRAQALRTHIDACPHCARELAVQRRFLEDLAAPPEGNQTELVARVLARLAPKPPRRWRVPMLASFGLVGAAALLVVVTIRPDRDRDAESSFVARGGTGDGLAREVGVVLHRVGPAAVALTPGERVGVDTRYLASYRNLGAHAPAHMLAFAVDSANTVHWLYPAYLDAATDPASLALAPVRHDTALADTVVLDNPVPGPLRLVTIVSAQPRRVSTIDRLSAAELQRDALASRFPDDIIRELVVVVDAPPEVPPP